eukprot:scaffold70208_cov26-Tisochrysis_lutea.AAC.3
MQTSKARAARAIGVRAAGSRQRPHRHAAEREWRESDGPYPHAPPLRHDLRSRGHISKREHRAQGEDAREGGGRLQALICGREARERRLVRCEARRDKEVVKRGGGGGSAVRRCVGRDQRRVGRGRRRVGRGWRRVGRGRRRAPRGAAGRAPPARRAGRQEDGAGQDVRGTAPVLEGRRLHIGCRFPAVRAAGQRGHHGAVHRRATTEEGDECRRPDARARPAGQALEHSGEVRFDLRGPRGERGRRGGAARASGRRLEREAEGRGRAVGGAQLDVQRALNARADHLHPHLCPARLRPQPPEQREVSTDAQPACGESESERELSREQQPSVPLAREAELERSARGA